jgi:hypothetical protein
MTFKTKGVTSDADTLDGVDSTGFVKADGTVTGATSQAQDFGSNGVKADVVIESTGSAGVDVEGVLVKDSNITLDATTSSTTGVIYKGADRFIHNFQHPTGDTAVPTGRNTFIGVNAGNFTMGSTAVITNHGSFNIGIGYGALQNNTTGYQNFAIGSECLRNNTVGYRNVGIGINVLYTNIDGYHNTSLGYQSLYFNTNGNKNTGYGSYSLQGNTEGIGNTAIGYSAGINITTGDYNTIIGYEKNAPVATADYQLVIGDYITGDGSSLKLTPRADSTTALQLATAAGTAILTVDTSNDIVDIDSILRLQERSSDAGDPAEGSAVLWMSDGTGAGDDGDIMMKITAGSTTKTVTLVDFSAV